MNDYLSGTWDTCSHQLKSVYLVCPLEVSPCTGSALCSKTQIQARPPVQDKTLTVTSAVEAGSVAQIGFQLGHIGDTRKLIYIS